MKMSLTTLDVGTLAVTMAETSSQAEAKINRFIAENGLTNPRTFQFIFVITQAGKKNYIHLHYAAVPPGTKGKGDINIVTLKHHHFVKIDADENGYKAILNGEKKEELEAFLKAKDLKLDLSVVLGLVEKINHDYCLYFQYK